MLTNEEKLEIEKKLLRRTEHELYRKEKHSNARLITNQEYTPEKFLKAFNRAKYECISKRDENKTNAEGLFIALQAYDNYIVEKPIKIDG